MNNQENRPKLFWETQLSTLRHNLLFKQNILATCLIDSSVGSKYVFNFSRSNVSIVENITGGLDLGNFVVLLGALFVTLRGYTCGSVVRIDTPPLKSAESANDVIPLILTIEKQSDIKQLLLSVKQCVSQSYNYQFYPVTMADAGAKALIDHDVFFCFDTIHEPCITEGLYDLVFKLETHDGFSLTIQDNAGFVTKKFITDFVECWETVLSQFNRTSTIVQDISLLSPAALARVLSGATGTEYNFGSNNTVVNVLRTQAQKTPEQIAIVCNDNRMSYIQLDNITDRLANYFLNEWRIQPGAVIAVIANRLEYTVIAMLATMKANAVYLPLDPNAPAERLRYVIKDAGACGILLHSSNFELISELSDLPIFALDIQEHDLPLISGMPLPPPSPTDTAYIIYTSGSTGLPKGVILTHEGLLNVALHHTMELNMTISDAYLQLMSFTFDGSILDVFATLLAGAALYICTDDMLKNIAGLETFIINSSITITTITPSYLSLLDRSVMNKLRIIISAGEQINNDDASYYSKHCLFYNGYGPSEITVNATLYKVDPGKKYSRIPIGKPSINKRIYILGDNDQLLPPGGIGEICIGGTGLAKGYINAPELTAKKFKPDPFDKTKLIYYSGDLGVYTTESEIVFKGRKDGQIKINGYRVEIDDIENNILKVNGVNQAAVLWDNNKLSVFYTAQREINKNEFQMYLSSLLPPYMIPGSYIYLKNMHLNVNKKTDKMYLLSLLQIQQHDIIAPENNIEVKLHNIWCDIFNLKQLSTTDNFFAVGGDSIRTIQLAFQAQQAGLKIDTMDVIKHQTIRELGEHIITNQLYNVINEEYFADEWATGLKEIIDQFAQNIEDAYPVSCMQSIMLNEYAKNITKVNGTYHCVATWRIQELALSVSVLKEAIQSVVAQYSILRSVFMEHGNENGYIQLVRKPYPVQIDVIDLSDISLLEQNDILSTAIKTDKQTPFQLNNLDTSFIRFKIFILGSDKYEFFLSAHHSIIDGWSMNELLQALIENYSSIKQNITPDKKTHFYKEFIRSEKKIMDDPEATVFWTEYLRHFHSNPLVPQLVQHHAQQFEVYRNTIPLSVTKKLEFSDSALIHSTSKAIFLSVFMQAAALVMKKDQLSVGVVSNGRSEHLSDPFGAVGLFWNIIPFYADLKDVDLKHLIRYIDENIKKMDRFARYPLTKIKQIAGTNNLFDVCFNFIKLHNLGRLDAAASQSGLSLLSHSAHDRFHYPLTVTVAVDNVSVDHRFDVKFDFDTSYFSREQIGRIETCMVHLLTELGELYSVGAK